MKKQKKQKKLSFLFRSRYLLGYSALILAFFALLIALPRIAPHGISQVEMDSAIYSSGINKDMIQNGNILDLPYHLVQFASLKLFGLNMISIKLPSIIFGVMTALFIVLLINRWFKSDVAIFGSVLTVLSTAFLFLSTSGSPTIMYLFWLSLILWLGSKIVGENHVPFSYIIAFFLVVALSIYTPHLCYIALAIAIAGLLQPHLRCSILKLKHWQLAACFGVLLLTLAPLVIAIFINPSLLQDLFFMKDFSWHNFATNISNAFAPFFSFTLSYDSVYLAPLFGLGTVALIFIGAIASFNDLFTSRNTVISLLIIFTIIFSGLNPNLALISVIPIAILSAAGIRSIFKKWHSLFPENPYAHFIGNLPVLVVVLMIVISGLSHFIYGYHYTPNVAKNFSDDVSLINKLDLGTILVIDEKDPGLPFYRLFEKYNNITVATTIPERHDNTITLYAHALNKEEQEQHQDLRLKQIITSSKSRNSDRLYIYEKIPAEENPAPEAE